MSAVARVMDDFVSTVMVEDGFAVDDHGLGGCGVSVAECDAVERILQRLRAAIGGQRFEMWFEGKAELRVEGEKLMVEAPNAFAANWIRTKFHRELVEAARGVMGEGVMGEGVRVEVTVGRENAGTAASAAARAVAREEGSHVEKMDRQGTAGMRSFGVVGERWANSGSGMRNGGGLAAGAGAGAGSLGSAAVPTMNAKYTLEEFVVGPSNQMAYHAAMQVAAHPGQQFNPLFLHGHCGLGKTHLLQGICQRFMKLHPGKKWLYLTGEQFTNEFLEAIRTHKTEAFRRRIRGADLLVIDDVHFLANKKATQEEFLHTFNQIEGLAGNGKQIVLASDCAPKQIAALSESLCSRFVSGMVLRIDSPDLPTRLEILRRRVARNGWGLSDAVLMHVAQSAAGSVRELEGLLLQVVAGASLIQNGMGGGGAGVSGGMTGTAELMAQIGVQVRGQIGDRTATRGLGGGPVPVEKIVGVVSEHFGVMAGAVLGGGREKVVTMARSLAMYLARQHTGMSFPEIGRAMGGKNHSTVIAACQRVEGLIAAGELVCWAMADGQRSQAVADVLHDLEGAMRRRK